MSYQSWLSPERGWVCGWISPHQKPCVGLNLVSKTGCRGSRKLARIQVIVIILILKALHCFYPIRARLNFVVDYAIIRKCALVFTLLVRLGAVVAGIGLPKPYDTFQRPSDVFKNIARIAKSCPENISLVVKVSKCSY